MPHILVDVPPKGGPSVSKYLIKQHIQPTYHWYLIKYAFFVHTDFLTMDAMHKKMFVQ
jgi:hypothetical protein